MKSEDQLPKRSSSTAASPPSTNLVIRTKEQGWWESLPQGMKTVVASFAAVAGMSLAAYLIFLYARKKVRQKKAANQQSKSFGKDKHATWAKQLHQGIDSWGTDESLIRRTLREIPSQEDFDKVIKSYNIQFEGANLIKDLTGDLSNYEYQEMMAIIKGKPLKAKGSEGKKIYDPKGWAKRLNAAVNYQWWGFMPGTDEEALKLVFQEIPTRKAFYETAKEYKKMFGVSLWADLDGDLDWSWDYRAVLKRKPAK